MEEDVLFLERLLSEEPCPNPPMIPNQTKSSIKEPEHSFSMGYEHFSTTLVTNEVTESSTKNLVPIPRECEVTSDNRIHVEDVQIIVSKIHSNPLFDDDEINSDKLESHVESNFVESTSNHDTVKFDNLDEFSGPLIHIHIAEEERIRREHNDYISRMEMLFTINTRPHPTVNANTNIESIPSSLIPIQDNDSQREEIDIITSIDDVLPPGVKNDDSDREVDAVEELHVDNSISNSEHESSKSEESDFDNPSVPLPPSEPPDKEFDFEIDFGDEISVVRNTIVEFECIDAKVKFDVSNDENDDYFYFMFDKVFSLLSAESEDTIFDPGFTPHRLNIEEENVVHQEEEEVDLEDISQIQDFLSLKTRSGNTTHANDSLPKYDSFCFEIEPDQERLINVMKNDISDDSSNDPLLEEADLFLASNNLIPPGIENFADDSKGDICFLEELLINDSILSHESSYFNFEDNPSIPQPPSEPPDAETNAGEEIPIVMKNKDKFDEDYYFFMFDKVFSLLSAESEDTIFDPGIYA
uniref:Reverse transcriptase domain-containing protein n=1 Tax=Tanacetum cinerariifolium TaxID=118510 RepID=A0A6L2NZ92_TANCI|nr:hypothetical protein [Tanacetum cinerariifolium]